jgi:hypothetical protein
MKMESKVKTGRVATATDGLLRPAVSATDLRPLAVRAVEDVAMTAEGMRMQQGLTPSSAERPVSIKVEAPAVHLLPSRILPQIEPISGRKHTELNRQIREVELLVTHRKQTTATCSNSQKIQKWTSPFLPEIAQSRMLSFSLRTEQAILPEGGSL